jgi:hypothetical protein
VTVLLVWGGASLRLRLRRQPGPAPAGTISDETVTAWGRGDSDLARCHAGWAISDETTSDETPGPGPACEVRRPHAARRDGHESQWSR